MANVLIPALRKKRKLGLLIDPAGIEGKQGLKRGKQLGRNDSWFFFFLFFFAILGLVNISKRNMSSTVIKLNVLQNHLV